MKGHRVGVWPPVIVELPGHVHQALRAHKKERSKEDCTPCSQSTVDISTPSPSKRVVLNARKSDSMHLHAAYLIQNTQVGWHALA